jgi:hypothetical protein
MIASPSDMRCPMRVASDSEANRFGIASESPVPVPDPIRTYDSIHRHLSEAIAAHRRSLPADPATMDDRSAAMDSGR